MEGRQGTRHTATNRADRAERPGAMLSCVLHYVKNDFEQRFEFFVGAAGDGAAPTNGPI